MNDPLIEKRDKIKERKKEVNNLEVECKQIEKERKQWPKLITIGIGSGKWNDAVIEALATECGWLPASDNMVGDNSIGPCSDGKYICSQAYLYYLAYEDGRLELVGAEDETVGKIGRTE